MYHPGRVVVGCKERVGALDETWTPKGTATPFCSRDGRRQPQLAGLAVAAVIDPDVDEGMAAGAQRALGGVLPSWSVAPQLLATVNVVGFGLRHAPGLVVLVCG